MTGYIGFENDKKNFLGKIIKKFTKSNWCHCFIMFSDDIVFESNFLKNELTPFSRKLKKIKKGLMEIKLFKIKKIHNAYLNMLFFVNDNYGKHYGWFQLLGFIPVILIKKLFGITIKNPFKKGDVCSELVLKWILLFVNNNEFNKLDMNTVTPQDLYQIITNSENFEEVFLFEKGGFLNG